MQAGSCAPLSIPPNGKLLIRHNATIVENIKIGADSPIFLETCRYIGNAATAGNLELFLVATKEPVREQRTYCGKALLAHFSAHYRQI